MSETTAFEATTLNREIVLRGLTPATFAKAAGLSEPTIYKALRGVPVQRRSQARIVAALGRIPIIAVADGLLRSA